MTSLADSRLNDVMTPSHSMKPHPTAAEHMASHPIYTSSTGYLPGPAFGGADSRTFMSYSYPGSNGMSGLHGSPYPGTLPYSLPFPGSAILDSMKQSDGE